MILTLKHTEMPRSVSYNDVFWRERYDAKIIYSSQLWNVQAECRTIPAATTSLRHCIWMVQQLLMVKAGRMDVHTLALGSTTKRWMPASLPIPRMQIALPRGRREYPLYSRRLAIRKMPVPVQLANRRACAPLPNHARVPYLFYSFSCLQRAALFLVTGPPPPYSFRHTCGPAASPRLLQWKSWETSL